MSLSYATIAPKTPGSKSYAYTGPCQGASVGFFFFKTMVLEEGFMINVVSKRWYRGEGGIYIGRPSVLGNPFAAKPSNLATERVSTNSEAVVKYRTWLREQWLAGGSVKAELLRLARLYKETGSLTLVCWCKIKPNDDIPCHGDVIRDAIEGIIAKGLV